MLKVVSGDMNRSEALMRAAMGVIGDLAEAYPQGEFSNEFREDWLTAMIKQVKTNDGFMPRTIETARWAREQVKRQVGGTQTVMS